MFIYLDIYHQAELGGINITYHSPLQTPSCYRPSVLFLYTNDQLESLIIYSSSALVCIHEGQVMLVNVVI